MRCKNPIKLTKTGPTGIKNRSIYVGCGKCLACMEKKRNEMSLRNYFELLHHNNKAVFVTLTYEDDKIPLDENKNPVLCMRDFQLFMKRLRKSFEPIKIRFYGCGEYGPTTHRPHYHVILYNLIYNNETYEKINKCWSKGFIKARHCDMASIRYTAKYMLTKLLDDFTPSIPEFHLSSRNPGIGLPYLIEHPEFESVFCDNLNPFYTMPGGYKLPLDRYLIDKVYSDTDRLELRKQRKQYNEEHEFDELREFMALYPKLSQGTKEFVNKYNEWFTNRYAEYERKKLKQIVKSHIL